MKKILVLFLIMLLSACTTEQQVEDPNPIIVEKIKLMESAELLSEYVQWYGRHTQIDDEIAFYNTATGFKVRFNGSAININLGLSAKQSDIYFSVGKDNEVLLDGDVFVLSESIQTLTVTFDTYGEHIVELVKRSEPQDGVTSLISLETNGEFLPVEINENLPHFLIIGGSGISGHGALGESWEDRTTENSSSLHSFGYLTASKFNGTYEFVSNSGWGLAFGYNDRTGGNNIAKAYEKIGINSYEQIVNIPYNHEVIPDIIIVNIGGNDYSAVINRLTGFDKETKIQEFKNAVADFILKLRADAPDAHIYWTMTEGSQNGAAAISVINLLSETDKEFVHVVTILQVGEDGTPVGANNHSSYETHLLSAQRLVDQIELFTSLSEVE